MRRRVINALDIARQTIQTIEEMGAVVDEPATQANGVGVLFRGKVVAETAMLLLCVEPIQHLDERIRKQAKAIAKILISYARHEDVLAAICLDPGRACDYGVAHAILSHLGFPDINVDNLLSKSLTMGSDFGPERLPHQKLGQAWLARVWGVFEAPSRNDADLVADSMIGRCLDALGSTRLDIYAFTHAVMYASDFGMRRISRVRAPLEIAADADAALAQSLDANDFDLTAEIALTWPMLGLPWSPGALFAFSILTDVEDRVGFLPGLAFDSNRHLSLMGEERSRFALATSYHASYVMGFLCAAALREDRTPPAKVLPIGRTQGASSVLLQLIGAESSTSCWREAIGVLPPRQQDSLSPLLLGILLRRARTYGNLTLVRDALEVALEFDLIDGPAPTQAAALLRRSQVFKL